MEGEARRQVGLTGPELSLIGGALSSQLRYAQRNLDRARDDDAVNRWAAMCVQLKALLDRVV